MSTLSLAESYACGLENIHTLIGPSLTTFSLRFSTIDCDEDAGVALLTHLKKLCPFLKNIDISSGPQTSIKIRIALSDLLCGLTEVRNFSSPCITLTDDAFTHLSTLSALRYLELGIQNEAVATPSLKAPSPGAFPALLEMSFWARHIEKAMESMHLMQAVGLKVLIFHLDTVPAAATLERFFSDLPDHCSTQSLNRIYGFQDDFSGGEEGDNIIIPDALRPLLSFVNLEYIWLNGCFSFELLDDALVAEMALAWPRLRQIDFGTLSCWGSSSKVTLNGLLPFCDNCPDLQDLGLCIDASISIPHTSVANFNLQVLPRNTHMTTLQVGHSKIAAEHVYAIAVFLSRIFPNLEDLAVWDGERDDVDGWEVSQRLWLEVRSLVVNRSIMGQGD